MTGLAAALVAILLWSTNAAAARFALAELDVIQVLALQFGGASATLATLRIAHAERATDPRPRGRLLSLPEAEFLAGVFFVGIVGLVGTIVLQYLAFATAPIVQANVVTYSWPLFAALWAAVTYRSRRTLAGVPLAIIGFVGVTLMLISGGDLGSGDGETPGYAAALASAVCMTFYTVVSGRSRISTESLLLPATIIGMVVALIVCVVGITAWQPAAASPGAWAASVYAGIGPMAGGFLLWGRAMSGDGAATFAPLGYATPLLSTVILLFFGETLTSGALVGALLVLVCSVGVMIFQGRGQEQQPDRD